jgi:iron complex outermembrane recepter protein
MRSIFVPLWATAFAFISSLVIAEEADLLATVVVTASNIEYSDVEAPYASEVHTSEQIKKTGSNTLYDYLDKHSSLVVLPSYGNPFTQKIDMRGYGIGDGYQNIVVSLNGRRLNNIDMAPQLLSSIPLETIDRIEITKGSGSVAYGDGATAGSIQIYTRPTDGVRATISAGNFGVRSGSLSAGLVGEMFDFTLNASRYEQDGFSDPDITGEKDKADSDSHSASLNLYLTDWLELQLGIDSTDIDTRYPGPLTMDEFKDDPAQNSGNTYTGQMFETDTWNFGVKAELMPGLEFGWDISSEDKLSEYSSGWGSEYEYDTQRLALKYTHGDLSLQVGVDIFDGVRIGSTNKTHKDNRGYFIQGDYNVGDTVYSAGVRSERVEYAYRPDAGAALKGEHDLTAWNLGLNHRYNDYLTVFGNINQAFQAPDVDRFFNYGGTFNAFIDPAESRTLNIGTNLVLPNDKLKIALFYVDLENEIYYFDSGSYLTSFNTNIDESHKYGLELQETHRFNDKLTGRVNYAYTRAIIDKENDGAGAFDGKELPGVSKHTVILSLDYKITGRSLLSITHNYRSSAYAASDFSNSANQKQPSYNSTDLTFTYTPGENIEIVAGVQNLFEEANGILIEDDAIYPVNFTRNWSVSLRAGF